jgi:hypothetical protein
VTVAHVAAKAATLPEGVPNGVLGMRNGAGLSVAEVICANPAEQPKRLLTRARAIVASSK